MSSLEELAGGDLKALRRIAKADRAAGLNGHDHGRPTIQLRGGGLAEHADEAERALAAATLKAPTTGVYARGSILCRPVRLRDALDQGGVRRSAGSLLLLPVDGDYLRLELTRLVAFERFDRRTEEWRPADCPKDVAASLLAAVPWATVPALTGVVEAPTLRPDGSLLDRPGYDRATGLLFDPGAARFDAIPTRPTKDQAEAALHRLLDILSGFPFADEASRSVVISAIITSVVRRSLRSAPMIGITAPKMASGKSLVATCISIIATGRPPAMISQAEDPESERKRLLALLLEGAAVVCIDNIERPLASAALCSILTEALYNDRVLGASRTASVATNALFLATGNNLTLSGDLTTRALVAVLDPGCERPEERRFAVNLHEAVPTRRAELVAAALTIPLAYLAAGAPKQDLAPFGRFEGWARWCRDPLVWLGLADPCASRARIEVRDPVRANLRALLEAWHDVLGDKTPQTVASAAQVAAGGAGMSELDPNYEAARHARYQALHEAIGAIAQQGREVNTRRLGNFIAAHEGRIEGGLSFRRGGTHAGIVRWQVQRHGGP